jgi:hypothetical protein
MSTVPTYLAPIHFAHSFRYSVLVTAKEPSLRHSLDDFRDIHFQFTIPTKYQCVHPLLLPFSASPLVLLRLSRLRLSSTSLSSAASLMSTVFCSTKRVLNAKQVATYGLVAAGINAVISTEIVTDYAYLVRATNPKA